MMNRPTSKFSARQLLLATLAVATPLAGCGQGAGPVTASAGSANVAAGAAAVAGSSASSAGSADLSAGTSNAGADSGVSGSGGDGGSAVAGAPDASAGSDAGGAIGIAGSGPSTVTTGVQMDGPLVMVDATQVKLAKGSPFYDRQDLHRTGFVASLDTDKLLFPFRKVAGLPQAAGVTAGYAGWDSTTLKGHIGGHYLSGASRLAAATGDTSFASKVNYMVTELGKCQDALNTGYIAGFVEGDSQVGAPYYVHHKVMAGLVDAYRYLGNQQALDIAVKMSNYLTKRLANTNYAGNSELGAMTDVLTEIYSLTKDDAHLKLAPKFEPTDFITPLASNQDQLKGLHGNMHIAFVVGGARYANVTGDATETSASQNFWSIVTGKHSYVHGGNSVHEWFQGPNVEAAQLPFSTGEECNSNNMLKITARLIERNQQPAEGDYFERTLVNHILSSMAPDTGHGTYFMPLHGGFRTYLDSTYCCMGTGIENTGRYNEGIYFKSSKLLLVNLYIPSEVTWAETGLSLKQEGYLPTTDTVTFTVTKATAPTAATIQFRIPNWVSGAVGLTINGQDQTVDAKPSTHLSINRTWQLGDVVKLKLPAALRIERARDQNNMVSIFYGPVLLAGKLGTSGMPSNDQAEDKEAYSKIADASVPDIVNASASPATWLTLTDLPTLTFKAQSSAGPAAGTTFQPLYAVHHERYSVYWNLRAN